MCVCMCGCSYGPRMTSNPSPRAQDEQAFRNNMKEERECWDHRWMAIRTPWREAARQVSRNEGKNIHSRRPSKLHEVSRELEGA